MDKVEFEARKVISRLELLSYGASHILSETSFDDLSPEQADALARLLDTLDTQQRMIEQFVDGHPPGVKRSYVKLTR